jgi:hypothetical protein
MKRVVFLVVPLLFALRRIRSRPLPVAVVAVALAAAAGLIGWSSIAAALSQDENVRLRLSEVGSDERSLQVVYHLPVGASDLRQGDVDAVFRKFADVTEPPRRVSMLHNVGPKGIRLVAVEDPERDVAISSGRLPAGCRARICEALTLAGAFRVGQTISLSPHVSVRIVGLGSLRPAALPVDSDALRRTPELTDEALLVRNFLPLADLAKDTGTSVVTTAALDPNAVRGSALRAINERLRIALVQLERTGPLIETTAPFAFLDELADRGDVAHERLLLVAGQGAALIVAFAAFAAAARRRDTQLLADQLTTLGASRMQTALARFADEAIPALLGAAAGVAALIVGARLVADRHGLPSQFVGDALSTKTLLAIALVTVGAIALLFVSTRPRHRSRFGLGALELTSVVALAIVVWQASASGALDPEGIEAGQRGGPILLLLPTLAFLASGVLLLRLLPFVLRLAERLARRMSFGLRLAFLTAARSPTEAAAATTFLAVALGVSLFGLNYRATLEQQAHDEARFAAGAAWRVVERAPDEEPVTNLRPEVEPSIGTLVPATVADEEPLTGDLNVTPLTRFSAITGEQPTPVLRLSAQVEEASVAGGELDVEVLAVPARRIPDVLGWRDSFSSLRRGDLAARLRPRPLRLRGPQVADDATAIRFWARSDAEQERFVVFHFLLPQQQRFVHVRGAILTGRWRPVALRVPGALRGAELVGLEFPAVSMPQSALPDEGSLQLGRFEQRRSDSWSPLPTPLGWAAGAGSVDVYEIASGPVRRLTQFNLRGSPLALIHPDIGLPEALPGAVSRSVAATAVDGRVTINLGGTAVPIRVAGRARFFPTVVERASDFIVLDYDTLFATLNAARPGVALPSEAWFFGPQRPDFLAELGQPPFRVERVVAAEPLAARLASDPLAAGAREVLLAAAVAAAALGLLGLILAARATLAAERLLLAEYEALGVRPATLARSTQLRLIALSLLGVVAGFLGGLLAVRLIGALVAVTGTAARPLPPIAPVVDWRVDAIVVATMAVAALVGAALLARRTLRETAARRLRA